jgi:Trk K+ transport system NAD-binding subunit
MPLSRPVRFLTFRLERWIQRGWAPQLALVAALIVAISATAGLTAWLATDAFAGLGEAIWWAFLRLTDPGYLGDDEGLVLRTLSTIVTVAGYVVFMGTLVAIMTQWLIRKVALLERGLTPIAARGHVVILGWSNRTPDLVRELVSSAGRMQRFLKRRGLRAFQLVILAEDITAARRQELADHVGSAWEVNDIILRTGSPLVADHLRRVDAPHASTVILPAANQQVPDVGHADARTVKTLMTLAQLMADSGAAAPPTVVAEILQAHTLPVAQAVTGAALEEVESDRMIARLIAQNTRHPGLSDLYGELFTYAFGNTLYLQESTAVVGLSFHEATAWFPEATLLGAVRGLGAEAQAHLNPAPDFIFEAEDQLVFIAPAFETTRPEKPIPRASHDVSLAPVDAPAPGPPETSAPRPQRILCLGWSPRVEPLLREYGGYTQEAFDITVVSALSARQREAQLATDGWRTRVQLTQVEGDYTQQAVLQAVAPETFDTILFVGSGRLRSGEETDARTLLGYMLLQKYLSGAAAAPTVVVELTDPHNAALLEDRPVEVIVPPAMMSHVLAHVALRRGLGTVFNELFGPGGAEIDFQRATAYGLPATGTHATQALRQAVAQRGQTLIGFREAQPGQPALHLNPPADKPWTLTPQTELVVLKTYT